MRDEADLLRRAVGTGVRGHEVQSARQRLQSRGERRQIQRAQSARTDAVRRVGQPPENGELLGLPIGQHRQHALDVGHRGQALERGLPGLEIRERRRRRERGEHGAAGGGGLSLPDDRLGAIGLEIQHVVVEAHAGRGPQRRSGHRERGDENGFRVAHEPLQGRDVKAMALPRLHLRRPPSTRAAGDRHEPEGRPPAIDQQQDGWEDGEHRQECEQDRGARDESEIADAAEFRGGQDVEGHGGGERTEQHAGPASCRRALEGADERPAEHPFFPKAKQEVDAVVGSEADDRRDEHHGEDREVPDEQRHEAEGPREAQREHDEHRARRHEPPEGDQ